MPSLLKVFKGPAVGPDGLPTVAERVRLATLKTLAGPDVQANNAVVALTQQGREAEVMTALRRRLNMPNPHKQWLALKVLEAILTAGDATLPRVAALASGIGDDVENLTQRPPSGAEGARVRSAALAVLPLLGGDDGNGGLPMWTQSAPMSPGVRGGGPRNGGLVAPVSARRRGSAMFDAAALSEEMIPPVPDAASIIARAQEVATMAKTSADLLNDLTAGIGTFAGASEADLLDELVVRCRGAQDQIAPMADALSGALDGSYHNEAQAALSSVLAASDAVGAALANAAAVCAGKDIRHAPAAARALERAYRESQEGASLHRTSSSAAASVSNPAPAASSAMADLLNFGDSDAGTPNSLAPQPAAPPPASPPKASAGDPMADLMSLSVPAPVPTAPVPVPQAGPYSAPQLMAKPSAPISFTSDTTSTRTTVANEFDDLFGMTPPSAGTSSAAPMMVATSPSNPFAKNGMVEIPSFGNTPVQMSPVDPQPPKPQSQDEFDQFFSSRSM